MDQMDFLLHVYDDKLFATTHARRLYTTPSRWSDIYYSSVASAVRLPRKIRGKRVYYHVNDPVSISISLIKKKNTYSKILSASVKKI